MHWYFGSLAGKVWTRSTVDAFRLRDPSERRAVLPATHRKEPRPPTWPGPSPQWITDQPWYLHTWRHDPTIQGMLVVLDEIHN